MVGAIMGMDSLDLGIMGTSSLHVDFWVCRVCVCSRCELAHGLPYVRMNIMH